MQVARQEKSVAKHREHSVKYSKRLMVNGEQLQDHVLIRSLFTLYCLPERFALCSEEKVDIEGVIFYIQHRIRR